MPGVHGSTAAGCREEQMKKRMLLRIAAVMSAVLIVATFLLIRNANRLLKYQLEQFLGKGFTVGSIELSWNGVQAEKVALARPDGKQAFSAEVLSVTADIFGLVRNERTVSALSLEEPYLLVEFDRNGGLIPYRPQSMNAREKSGSGKQISRPVLVKEMKIRGGSLHYIDRKVQGGPVRLKFRAVRLDAGSMFIPPGNVVTAYELVTEVEAKGGNGRVSASGTLNMETRDTKTKLRIRDVDVTELKPYYQKTGDVSVTKGRISVDADILIKNSRITSSGTIVLRDLEFESRSGTFLGLPLAAVIALLKDRENRIDLDFSIEGDLKNPKFNIRDSLVQKVAIALARALGMPIEAIGRSVFDFGGSALKKLFGQP